MKYIVLAVSACLLMSGCDQVREKLHMMPNQDEQACLNSERFNFKDPDVLFVANLGSRGLLEKPDQYWVRYKAKNSYGAYGQGNMLCKKDDTGKWIREKVGEYMTQMDVQIFLIKKINAAYTANDDAIIKSMEGKDATDVTTDEAREIVFTSADDLAKYKENPDKPKK